MSKKRIAASIVVVFLMVLLNIMVVNYKTPSKKYDVVVEVTMASEQETDVELFYLQEEDNYVDGFKAIKSEIAKYRDVNCMETLTYSIPGDTEYIRIDPGTSVSDVFIKDIRINSKNKARKVPFECIENIIEKQEVEINWEDDTLEILATGNDPYLVWDVSEWDIDTLVQETNEDTRCLKKALLLICLDIIAGIVLCYFKRLIVIPIELWHNRKLIMQLSINDFKTKFAGSYLGIIWAFIQPIVTVLVYWFVFQKGLNAAGMTTKAGIEVPFVLWLVAGLVPWFFFQDALNGGTNALVEYSYLVKKVVFKISILPIVKVISALFVHLFFIVFTLGLYACYGYWPDVYTLQIIYYSLCMLILVLGITYFTSAIVGFFRDLSQIIAIILQVGMWMTPIMWNIDTMELPSILLIIFKLNPMYYIVAGYRDALINKIWFWENSELSICFWMVTVLLFGIGITVFKRLKIHFADVL